VKVSDFAEPRPKLMLDEEKMVRVAVNVTHNAVEAMPQKGELTIRSSESGGNVELSFSDTGMGMTQEALSRIWTPFSTTKAKGMGLGLPMSKQIVEAHGGSISVKSAVGKGTTVTITMPINAKPKEGAA
jgi:signal transduction histidine kinase